jgi:large subunit ribosomal protein L39
MRVLSAEMIKLSRKRLPIERLEVEADVALEMFQHNKYKSQQIPEIAQSSPDRKTICLYRVGDFVDISKGPMMTHTGHVSKCTITAVHPIPKSKTSSETLYRIQGVALPSGILVRKSHYHLKSISSPLMSLK